MDVNRVILQQTLKMFINVVTFKVDKHGVETNNNVKMSKKKFMTILDNEEIRVKLVDKYPEIMDNDIIYVRKDGRTVWIKEVEK
jgi:hypothetical protein